MYRMLDPYPINEIESRGMTDPLSGVDTGVYPDRRTRTSIRLRRLTRCDLNMNYCEGKLNRK